MQFLCVSFYLLQNNSLAECFTMNIIASTGFGMDVDAHDNPNAGFVRHAKIAMTYTSSAIQAVCGEYIYISLRGPE